MNYLKKELLTSFKPRRTTDPDGIEMRRQSDIRNVNEMAEALGMTRATLYRWLDNPALRKFDAKQLEILHNQLHWSHTDFEGNQIIHIKQTTDLLERDLQSDQEEGKRGQFGSRFDQVMENLSDDDRRVIERGMDRETRSAVKRSLEESTARLNILTEQLRVSQTQLAEALEKINALHEREDELRKNLDFARMVADRFSYFAKQQDEMKTQIDKLAS